MSALQWRDWSCAVRVVLADGRAPTAPPAAASARAAEQVVRGLMDDVARSADRFNPTSDVRRVTTAAGRLVPVRPLTLDLVELALRAARDTDGACDPTVGRHVLAAGYDVDIAVVRTRPHPPVVGGERLRSADWRAVRIDRRLGLLGVPAGLGLDLGATAKAWTADEAAARLERALEVPALVALGGDVAVSGDAGWPVLVSEREGGAGEVVTVRRGGLATSSTRVRRWQTPDGEAHHIIDPGTGRPTTGAARTASVLAASCLAANALSTAALVWGADARERLQSHAARLVDADGRVVRTDGWPSDRPAGGAAA